MTALSNDPALPPRASIGMSAAAPFRLVGDVGGTHARFALASWSAGEWKLLAARTFLRSDFGSLETAIEAFLRDLHSQRPSSAVIAVAGPVSHGAATLTNGQPWRMSEAGLQALGFGDAAIINDYAALAHAVGGLTARDVVGVGDHKPARGGTIAVVGAGTGLGVSALVIDECSQAVAITEGGHAAFAPGDEVEIEILRQLSTRFERVSLERVLSGPGLANLHWALGRIRGRDEPLLDSTEIVRAAIDGQDATCLETLHRFCKIYGACAGDVALSLGAEGGVYLAGGIAPKILPQLQAGAFREMFEAKGRLSSYVQPIPTQVIVHPFAALIGASAYPAAPSPSRPTSAIKPDEASQPPRSSHVE